jgi:hypothetical protein
MSVKVKVALVEEWAWVTVAAVVWVAVVEWVEVEAVVVAVDVEEAEAGDLSGPYSYTRHEWH